MLPKRLLTLFAAVCLLGVVRFATADSVAYWETLNDHYIRADRLGITFISGNNIPRSPERYERALRLGAGWNRFPIYWNEVETAPLAFDWGDYDAVIEDDFAHGLRSIAILLGRPDFHSNGRSIEGLRQPIFTDNSDTPGPGKAINPANPWALYVFRTVARYMPGGELALEQGWTDGRGITVWEVWNEPDLTFFWEGSVHDYARMLEIAYRVIKALDPDATVLLGGLAFPSADYNYLAGVLGIYERDPEAADYNWYLDGVGIHNYSNTWRSGFLTRFANQTLAAYQLRRPIWMTETGAPVGDDYPGPTWQPDAPGYASAAQQAAFFVQSAAYAWADGARMVLYHQLYDDCGNQPPATDFPPHNGDICADRDFCFGDAFGLFRNPAGSVCFSQHPQPDTARPVARAFQMTAQVFGTEPFSARGLVDDDRPDGAAFVTFTRPLSGERIIVLWNTTDEPLTVTVEAHSIAAFLHRYIGQAGIFAADGVYTIDLPPAEVPRAGPLDDLLDIGGEPVILVESVIDAAVWADLVERTTGSS